MLEQNHTPWYPNMKLYRQKENDNWEEVFQRINKNLQSEEIVVETKGGSLSVCFTQQNNTFTNVWLKGPAAFVFKGEIDG